MPTATKIQVQAELDSVRVELGAALARVSELELARDEALALVEAAQTETRLESNRLEQTIWLQKNRPSKDWSRGTTQGGKPFIRFGGQFSRLDKASGERRFGDWKNYVAYGETAEAVEAAFKGSDRLAHVVCFEQPSHGTGERSLERYTDWVVTEFALVPRVERSEDSGQPPAAAPLQAEPTMDEIPF